MNLFAFGKRLQKSVAGFLVAMMLTMPVSAGVVSDTGNVVGNGTGGWDISGGIVNGNNTFNRFTEFLLEHGITNQYFNTANAINMMQNGFNINAVYNAIQNGNLGQGNVLFISPTGMAVGAGGVLNVGSMQAIVPTQAAYNNLINNYTGAGADGIIQDLYNPANISTTGGVLVEGRIIASSGLVKIAANQIEFRAPSGTVSTGEYTYTDKDGNTVNHAGDTYNSNTNIKALGEVSLIVNTDMVAVGEGVNIDTNGKVELISYNGNIGANGADLKLNADGTITANAANGNVYLASKDKAANFKDVQAGKDLSLKTTGSGKLTTSGTTSGANVTLVSAADVETGIVNATGATGVVNITSQTGMTQTAGTAITSNNGSTAITNNTSGDIVLSNVTAKGLNITNNGGKVNIKTTAGSTALNSTGNTSIIAKTDIDQEGTGTALSSTGTVNLEAKEGKIGTTAFKLNSDGAVTAKAATGIKLQSPLKKLIINKATTTSGDVELTSETSDIEVTDTVSSGSGAVKLTSAGSADIKNITAGTNITVSTKTGLSQKTGGEFRSTNGSTTLTNANSGDIVLSNVTAKGLNITNNGGKVNIKTTAGSTALNSTGNTSIIAKTDIDQEGTGTALSSTGTVNLEAKEGKIGTTAFKLNSDGAITANAATGIKLLSPLKKLLINKAITTSGDVELTTETSGIEVTDTVSSNTGAVKITSAGSADIKNITAGTNITVSTKTGLSQKTGGEFKNTVGGTINLANTGSGNISLVKVTNKSGNILVNNSAANGDVILNSSATPVLKTENGDVSVSAGRNITQTGNNIAIDSSKTIALNAGSNLGTDAQGILIKALGNVTSTSVGNTNLGTTAGNTITMGAVSTGGNFKFDGGSLSLTQDLSANNITLSNLNALTAKGLNASNGNILLDTITTATLDGNVIASADVTFKDITTLTAKGDIQGVNVNATRIGTFNQDTGKNITATTGDVVFNTIANAGLNNITAGKNVTFDNITSGNFNNITATGGKVSVKNTNKTASAITSTGEIKGVSVAIDNVTTGNFKKITATAGNIDITNTGGVQSDITATDELSGQNVTINGVKTATLNKVSATNNVNVTTTGALTYDNLVKGKIVTFNAGDIIANGANALINANTANLTSAAGIGTINNGADNTLKLTSDSTDMTVNATAGTNAYLSSNKNTTYNAVSAGNEVNLNTTGNAKLTTTGETKGAVVKLTSNANAQVGAITSTNTLDIKTKTGLTQTAGTKLSSTNKTTVNNATSGDVTLSNAQAGSLEIVNAGGDVVIDTSANTGLISNGATSLTGKNIIQKGQGTAITNTAGNITLNATAGDIKNQAATSTPDKNATFKVTGAPLTATATGNVFLSAALKADGTYNNDLTITNVSGQKVYLGARDLILNAMSADSASLIADNLLTVNTNLSTANGLTIDANSLNLNSHTITNSTANNVNIYTKSATNLNAITNLNGDINIGNKNGSYTLNGIVNGKNVNVDTTGALLSALAGEIIASNNIVLTAGSIGNDSTAMNVTAGSSGTVTATTNTGMNLNSKSANTTFGALKNNTSGNIKVKTAGNATFVGVTNKNGNINIGEDAATGSYTLSGLVDGKNVTIATKGNIGTTLDTAAINATGDISLKATEGTIGESKALNVTTKGKLSSISKGNTTIKSGSNLTLQNIQSTNGNVDISTTAGNITVDSTGTVSSANNTNLNAKGDLVLGGTVSATTANLTGANLEATNLATINANTVNLTATGGKIGKNGVFNIKTNGAVNAKATSDINIMSNDNNLKIDSAASTGGGAITLANKTSGKITVKGVSTSGNITIDNQTAGGVDIDTTDGTALNATGSTSKVTVNSGGDVTQKGTNTAINSGGTAAFNVTGDVKHETSSSALKLAAVGNVDVRAKSANLEASSGTLKLGNVNIDNAFDYTGDDLILNGDLSAGTINIHDITNLTQNSGTITASAGDATFKNIATAKVNNVSATGNVLFDTISNLTATGTISGQNLNFTDIGTLTANGAISGTAISFDNIGTGTFNSTIKASAGDVTFSNTKGITSNILSKGEISGRTVKFDNVTTANLDVINATQNVDILTSGATTLNKQVKAPTVKINAGNIVANTNASINAPTVELTSKDSIGGTSGEHLKLTSDGNISVKANATNNVYLTSDKSTTFDGVTGGNEVNLKTTGVGSKLTTTNTTTGKNITLKSDGVLEAGALTSNNGGNILITSAGAMSQTANTKITSAGSTTINSASSADVRDIEAGTDVSINSDGAMSQAVGTKIKSRTGSTKINSKTTANVSDIEAGTTVSITSTGAMAQESGTKIISGTSTTINSGSTATVGDIEAGTDVSITTADAMSQTTGTKIKSIGSTTIDSKTTANVQNIDAGTTVSIKSKGAMAQGAGTTIKSGGSTTIASESTVGLENIDSKGDLTITSKGNISQGTGTTVSAVGDAKVTNNGTSGDVSLQSFFAKSANILNNVGNVIFNKSLTANGGDVTVSAKNISADSSAVIGGNNITLTATTGSIGNSTTGNHAAVNVNADGNVKATAGTGINLNSTGKDLKITSATSTSNDVILKTTNSGDVILLSTNTSTPVVKTGNGASVSITSAGSIIQNGAGLGIDSAKDITLTSGATVGTAGQKLVFVTGTNGKLSIPSAGLVNIGTLADRDVTLGDITTSDSFTFDTAKNMTIDGTINAGKSISFKNLNSYTQNAGKELIAVNDITLDTVGKAVLDKITTSGGKFELLNGKGDVLINDLISATNGSASITTTGNIAQKAGLNIAITSGDIALKGNNIGTNGDSGQAINLVSTGKVKAEAKNGININSVGHDVEIDTATTDAGKITISASGNNANIVLNDIAAKNGDLDVINNADGKITLKGKMTVGEGKTANIKANGKDANVSNAGVDFKDTSTVDNSGTLNIQNKGSLGTTLAGQINNKSTGKIDVTNTNGNLLIAPASAVFIDNAGIISLKNSGSGQLKITGSVKNAKGAKFEAINDGLGGLDFNTLANVENRGIFELTNNAGNFKMDGNISMFAGSVNTFTDGTANDFVIKSDLTNNGATVTFQQTGTGNLVVDSGTKIVNNSGVDSDGQTQNGIINLNNSNVGSVILKSGSSITNNVGNTVNIQNTSAAGNIELQKGSVINNNSGTINIKNILAQGMNKADKTGNIIINGKIDGSTTIDGDKVASKNNTVNIINDGTKVSVAADTDISYIDNLKITNTTNSKGDLEILGTLGNNGNITLENLNSFDTQINIGNNTIHTNKLLKMTNYGQGGLNINGDKISSNGGIHLESNNSITINGTLKNDESKNTTTNHKGIQIKNIKNDGTVNNDGITINGTISSNAKYHYDDVLKQNVNANQIINLNDDASSSINITENAKILTNGGIDIISDGGGGVILDGIILNSVHAGMPSLGGDINITANNADIALKHYDLDANGQDYDNTPVRVKNEQGGISVKAENITNENGKTGVSLIATGDIKLTATKGSVGVKDGVIDSVKNDGYLNPDGNSKLNDGISVNVLAGGKTSASATGDINLRSYKMVKVPPTVRAAGDAVWTRTNDMDLGSINAGGTAILPSILGSVDADSITAKDSFVYSGQSMADGGHITIGKIHTTGGKFSAESMGDIIIKSSESNKQMNADYIFSKDGNIDISLNGNANIGSITAPGTVKVSSTGDVLHFDSVGKFDVERARGIIPIALKLGVYGTESGMKNSLLEIDNAYVRDSVELRADNIHAQETIDPNTGLSNGHGFHSANTEGKLVKFDIQGANYTQYDKLSPIYIFGNPNYKPDPNDKRVLDLKLTIGDVEVQDAIFGAQFDKVYSDNAFINATNKISDVTGLPIAAEFNFDNITINDKGRIQNNKYTVDVNNVDFNYDYNADATLYTGKTGSFRMKMGEDFTVDTTAPIIVYNPHRIFNLPHTENSFQRLTNKSNRIEAETALGRFRDRKKNTRTANDRKDIRWSIAGQDHKVLGSSSTGSGAAITDILDLSKGGMLVSTSSALQKGEILNVNFTYKGIPFDVKGEVVRIDDANTAGIKFVNVDRFTSNIILYMTMMDENL